LSHGRISKTGGFVGVKPDRGVQLRNFRRHRYNLATVVEICSRVDYGDNPGCPGSGHHIGSIFSKSVKIQMTVGVNQHLIFVRHPALLSQKRCLGGK
jgi:hypothetical protein